MMGQRKPNLFIVGAAKSGTTSLYMHLSQHNQIFGSSIKEPRYLTKDKLLKLPIKEKKVKEMILEEKDYLNLYKGAEEEKYIIDGSVYIMMFEEAIEKIKENSDNYRVIVILRNPITRFISHYKMSYNLGDTKKNIIEFIKNPIGGMGINLLEIGLYSKQIKNLFSILDKNKIKIILLEDIKSNLETVLLSIYEFLQIEKQLPKKKNEIYFKSAGIKKNDFLEKLYMNNKISVFLKKILINTKIRNLKFFVYKLIYKDLKINEKTYDYLYNYYIEDIEKLENLLEMELSKWKMYLPSKQK